MYYMNNKDAENENLEKIICVRLSRSDYKILLKISEEKQSTISEIVRTIIGTIAYIAKNNRKD